MKVDSSVNPFVVFLTNVLYQLLVFGCIAIAKVAFGNCGVLRLQEFKFLGACNLKENWGSWEGDIVCSKSFCIFYSQYYLHQSIVIVEVVAFKTNIV